MNKRVVAVSVLALVLLLAVVIQFGLLSASAQSRPYTAYLPILIRNGIANPPVSSLRITKSLVYPPSGMVRVGDPVEFRIEIQNTGTTDVSMLPLDDVFDAEYLEFLNASPAADVVAADTLQWRDLTTLFPRGFNAVLKPGSKFSLNLRFRAKACPPNQLAYNRAVIAGAKTTT